MLVTFTFWGTGLPVSIESSAVVSVTPRTVAVQAVPSGQTLGVPVAPSLFEPIVEGTAISLAGESEPYSVAESFVVVMAALRAARRAEAAFNVGGSIPPLAFAAAKGPASALENFPLETPLSEADVAAALASKAASSPRPAEPESLREAFDRELAKGGRPA